MTTTKIITDDIITNDQDVETFSSEDQVYDYLSIQNLNNRFGLDGKGFDTFIIKELMDNALDFIDQNAKEFVNGKEPFIDVDISQDIEKEVTKIRFRNSNAGINNLFSSEEISNIFNLNKYYSNKRYRHKINRGELGDAFKAILGIPYAIAIDDESGKYHHWDYPLEINISNDKRAIKIRIDNIDKIRRKEEFNINTLSDQFYSNEEISDFNHFTEIVVYLPKVAVNYIKINNLLKEYVGENTYIDFKFKIWPLQILNSYPATQKIVNDWKNKLSIYYYSLADFKYLIYSLEKSKDNFNIYDNFIHTNFREGWKLKRDEFFETLTYGDLKKDDKKIEEVYNRLKNTLLPIKEQSTSLPDLELPFDMKRKARKKSLEERLKQVYSIEKDSFVYNRFDRYYENPNGNGVQFPYKLEIMIAKSPRLKQKQLKLIESLNCSPSLRSTSLFHTNNNESRFRWIKKNGEPWTTNDITKILEDCGYSDDNEKLHKKDGNLIIINLISPRIDYGSHSKSDIDLKPFTHVIGQDIYNFCKTSLSRNKNNSEETTDNNKYHLRIWLKERWKAVQRNPELLTTGRITLDGVYYRLRTRLDQLGIKIKDRDYIKDSIRDICENEMGLKRAELGIIAAERAQFYYKGETYGVGIDEISQLEKYAADIIIIEKQGAVEALASFADKQGIGLLYTRGFSTEYALELIEKTNSNVIVLTDLDASGLLIQTKLPNNKKIYRVGVGQEMLDHFGLNFKDVSETYKPQEGHYDTVAEYLEENDYNIISKELFERIEKERVEIDSVLSQVSNKEFWEYIVEFLDEKFEYRNYNRSIEVPKSVIPSNIQKLIDNITDVIIKAQGPERHKIMNELEYTEEIFDDIEEEESEIDDRLVSCAENDPEVKNQVLGLIKNFSFN